MGRKYDPLVLILVLATIKASAANVDDSSTKQKRSMASMVATLCDGSGSPNVYLTPDNGWQATDVGSDADSVRTKPCLDDKKDILQLCKMMYSDQDVRNIMEVEHTIINHWPDRNGYKHQHNVTAYKCLVGPFESEALLVPQSCKFQHTKGPCGSLLYWKKEAMAMCEDMHMYERIYSILLPCVGRVAEFAGVEYVCCPKENIHNNAPAATPKPDKHEPHEVPKSRDAYTAYIQNDQAFLSRYRNEHEKFMAAKAALDLRHRTQIDKMTQEWQEASRNIKKVRETDKKKAEKLYNEVMTRFQGLYKGLEQAYVSEKTQLIAVHLQRRQGVLNKKKREYLEQYMLELQNPKTPNIHSILKYLKDYIKVEEKDREHTYNHFLHVRDSNPEEAHRIQPVALEHLKVIDQRIQQSLDMLNKLPDYSKLIMPKIERFREPYMATANQALETLSKPLVINTPNEQPKKTSDVNLKTDSSINTKIDWGTPSQTKGESDDSQDENATEDDDSFDEEVDEDESQQVNFVANENNFVAHAAENKHIFKEAHVLQSAGHLQSATGSVFGIAIGSVAVFVIIVVAVIMLRKHSHRRPVTHGFVEVDPAASPEERHVANMQMNGYENPTYQYFELNSNQQKL